MVISLTPRVTNLVQLKAISRLLSKTNVRKKHISEVTKLFGLSLILHYWKPNLPALSAGLQL